MSTLEVRLISLSLRLMLARAAFFTQAKAALIPGTLNNRENEKGNLSYLALIQHYASV